MNTPAVNAVETDFSTPMMKQYFDLKAQYQDCLLFFRLGDFYELFMDDAKIGAGVLDITLTSRDRGRDGRIPMAGVPFHAVDVYINKLVRAGYKVAICEQMTEPGAGTLVERDVIRIVTPGTILDESSLERKENNYLITLSYDHSILGIAVADLSTGFFQSYQLEYENLDQTIANEVARINPSECVLPLHLYNQPKLLKTLKTQKHLNIFLFDDWVSFAQKGEKVLKEHFQLKTLASFGLEDKHQAIKAASGLLGYLKHTQKDKVSHIKKLVSYSDENYLELDRSTILNLELFSTIREGNKKGSLIHLLDKTSTSMGGRLLRQWMLKPLSSSKAIIDRHEMVSELLGKRELRANLIDVLSKVVDIERLLSRLAIGVGNARDLVNLKLSLIEALEIKQQVLGMQSELAYHLTSGISSEIQALIKIISDNIVDEPPIDMKIGGMIRLGVSKELDELKDSIKDSKTWVSELETKERTRTGISTLKVKFNQVFGYYIEITKSNLANVPSDYFRKQTLVNAERFITPELKHHEELILTAEEKIKDLEFKLFLETVQKVLHYTIHMQEAAKSLAQIDCLLSFAQISEHENYVKPEITDTDELNITGGRHPVVENLLDELDFVPNDVQLNSSDRQLILITGPNMAGKSVYIRQCAVIVLMAQMGCFVPAATAHIGVVDKIFVRSGASDVITSGLSTFMVEMVETATILNHTTSKSLIIMDEIGRGTSTYDGISIAWSVAEYLVANGKVAPKTLFATHYHELQKLAEKYPDHIKNYQVIAEEEDGELRFLHKVEPGGASHSYGIAVARLAGVPKEVTDKAIAVLNSMELRGFDFEDWLEGKTTEFGEGKIEMDSKIAQELKTIDINKLTPIEALEKLSKLKELCSL